MVLYDMEEEIGRKKVKVWYGFCVEKFGAVSSRSNERVLVQTRHP